MNTREFDEVKQALQRIQRIASEPIDDTDVSEHAEDDAPPIELNGAGARGQPSDAGQPFVQRAPARLRLRAIVTAAVIGAVGLGSWLWVDRNREPGRPPAEPPGVSTQPAPQRPAVQAPGDAARAMSEAANLLEAGRVSEARRALTDLPNKSTEVALILARSYDPNYLRLIPNADAAADPAEAERWYRIWRDIATERGLVLEQDRFDRIIKAMR